LIGIPAQANLPALAALPSVKIDLSALAPLAATLELIRDAGLTD
jgi:iron(III) transport system substrate-binding protein